MGRYAHVVNVAVRCTLSWYQYFDIKVITFYVQVNQDAKVNDTVPYDVTQDPIFPSELQVR